VLGALTFGFRWVGGGGGGGGWGGGGGAFRCRSFQSKRHRWGQLVFGSRHLCEQNPATLCLKTWIFFAYFSQGMFTGGLEHTLSLGDIIDPVLTASCISWLSEWVGVSQLAPLSQFAPHHPMYNLLGNEILYIRVKDWFISRRCLQTVL
jgi:hypothetical protein